MLRRYVLGIFLLVPRLVCAEIIETKTLKDVLPKADAQTLVVLDIDNTILYPLLLSS